MIFFISMTHMRFCFVSCKLCSLVLFYLILHGAGFVCLLFFPLARGVRYLVIFSTNILIPAASFCIENLCVFS